MLFRSPKIEQSSSYEDNITLSTAAYEEVITHFRTTDGKFTDDFGGVYVDENGLHNICVVGDRKPVTSDYIIYKQVDNAYNFLESIVGNLSIESKRFSIWMISICENCNIVLVCLEDERKISPLIEHLKSNNLFRKGTLNIFVGSNEIVLT